MFHLSAGTERNHLLSAIDTTGANTRAGPSRLPSDTAGRNGRPGRFSAPVPHTSSTRDFNPARVP
jgi:hypothetical protein